MRILVLQLARFGDIYQTWPTLRGLRRVYPEAEVHLLVRERFAGATEGLDGIVVHTLPTRHLLEPVLTSEEGNGPAIDLTIERFGDWLKPLQNLEFDRIINLSFSPHSSFLVSLLAHEKTIVHGYTRFRDGYFAIPDDASAYFHAQVGVTKDNRIHLVDLMALVAGIELYESDFEFSDPASAKEFHLPKPYIAVHLGASQAEKRVGRDQWKKILRHVLVGCEETIVFLGGPGEQDLVPQFEDVHQDRIVDLVGKTQLADLFPIIRKTSLLLGGDSVAMQIAALTKTRALQFSFSSVRYWETGPRVPGSRILYSVDTESLDVVGAGKEIIDFLSQRPLERPVIYCHGGFGVLYEPIGLRDDTFPWELVRSLYMGAELPQESRPTVLHAAERLSELAQLALEQIDLFGNAEARADAVRMFGEVEALISQVGKLVSEINPLIRWYETEKLRIGPGNPQSVFEQTARIFRRLKETCGYLKVASRLAEDHHKGDLSWK